MTPELFEEARKLLGGEKLSSLVPNAARAHPLDIMEWEESAAVVHQIQVHEGLPEDVLEPPKRTFCGLELKSDLTVPPGMLVFMADDRAVGIARNSRHKILMKIYSALGV